MIKAILFDLGGVLWNIDYDAPVRAFNSLGVKDFKSMYAQASQSRLFDDLETGKITPIYFYEQLNEMLDHTYDHEVLKTAWNSILLDFPLERLIALKQIAKNYPIYLLSNTNQIHEDAINEILKAQFGIDGLKSMFNAIFLSHKIGDRKPNLSAFNAVLAEINISANEIIYIEDSPQHIAAAEKLGFKTLYHKTNADPFIALKAAGILY